jgi:hypothetical protein
MANLSTPISGTTRVPNLGTVFWTGHKSPTDAGGGGGYRFLDDAWVIDGDGRRRALTNPQRDLLRDAEGLL